MSMHPDRNLFSEFKGNCRVFIETGCWRGDGIRLALDAGFRRIISIDTDSESINFCNDRFNLLHADSKFRNIIKLHEGNSAEILAIVIASINEPVMFWLDAHAQHIEGEQETPNPYPLMDELKAIRARGYVGHTILIDDILHLTHPDVTGWDKRDIERAAEAAVGPGAKIEYFANPVKNNILIAHI